MAVENPKIRIAVLYGGKSAEHEVSVQSAKNIIQNLDPLRFEVIPIGIDYSGHWYDGSDIFLQSVEQQSVPKLTDETKALYFSAKGLCAQKPSSIPEKKSFDVIFPAVHGTFCEDGTLQGLLEQLNIPYVGSGVLASAMGMDKDVAKRLVNEAGVPVHPYLSLKKDRWRSRKKTCLDHIIASLTFPVFVKPANTGSSIGVQKVKTKDELEKAIDHAFLFDTKILVEQGIRAIELELAVLQSLQDGEPPIVSVVGEVKPNSKHEFYSYDAKYLDEEGAALIIPAPITEEQAVQAKHYAQQICEALEVEGMARVDLFLDQDTQRIYFNEINTLPGFTRFSMYPKLMDASGMAYTELLTHLVELALKRAGARSELTRAYDEGMILPS